MWLLPWMVACGPAMEIPSLRERPSYFQGGGGGWVFQSDQNIFFCHFQVYFCSIYHEPDFFSLKP